MNKTFPLFLCFLLAGNLLFPSQAIAQAPDKLSYQAVIRDASGNLVTEQEVGLRVSILQNSIEGTVVYQEIYNPNPETNNNGLLTIEIGAGVSLTGTFSEIDWSEGPYFLKTETDPSGGTTYTITGTSQLLSAPYALHSKSSEILTGEITESQIADLQKYLTGISDQPIGDLADVDLSGLESDMGLKYDEDNEHWIADYENDPLFAASLAAGIDDDDMENWNEAHSWGDHSEGGYITEVSAGTGLSGGGTSGAVTLNIDGSVVRTSGDQTIGGNKTFTGITTVAEPVNTTDAVTKAYVDDILALFGISLPDNYAGTVTDIDGNTYRTVIIGTQTWISENLRTGRYNDGTTIPFVTDNSTWEGLTTPGYRWYNNEANYNTSYGALYNWYAIDPASNGGNNLCPAGWHVPADAEWTVLIDYLGGVSEAGGKLKETGTTHWRSPNTGATNETGFTALPGGYCNSFGTFYYIGYFGYWWSATQDGDTNAFRRSMQYGTSYVYKNAYNKKYGFSVRCLQDS